MSNHTKGPWKWDGSVLFSTTEKQDEGEHLVLVLGRPFSAYDEDRALIAAAPDLYEALKLLVAECSAGTHDAGTCGMILAKNLINQIEGE